VATERPLRTISVLLVSTVSTLLGGCAASGTQDDTQANSVIPLQLWSDHKALEVPVAVCGEKGFNVLTALGYSNVVRNGNFSYGHIGENRAAVKCVEMPKGSFVYFAVASRDKETAENLRNAIAWQW
jgi:hypothetical protein